MVRNGTAIARACRLLLVSCVLPWVGCAGHAARTERARSALDAGQPATALQLLDEEMDVPGPETLPEKMNGNNALLVLDRAMVLQQLERYDLSSRDLEAADKSVELLDFSRTALSDVGKFLFSDASGPYRAPPYEKLFINTLNMVNYLARGDLGGARIEARRLAVMQKYFRDTASPSMAMCGPGSYLAGFVYEKSGDPDEALHYYDDALAYGSYASLREPVQRLAAQSSYRSPRLTKLLAEAPSLTTATSAETTKTSEASGTAATPTAAADSAEILVVFAFGRVPAKVAKRVPIGLALTYASGSLSPNNYSRANALAAQGLVTWVNFPAMEKIHRLYGKPFFELGSTHQSVEGLMAVDQAARADWEKHQGVVVGSAITRMITRVVAGEAVRHSTGNSGEGRLLGLLLSLGTQATMTALDTPDTRSWSTLPARLAVARVRVKPGTYSLNLGASGFEKHPTVTLKAGGWTVVNLTALN